MVSTLRLGPDWSRESTNLVGVGQGTSVYRRDGHGVVYSPTPSSGRLGKGEQGSYFREYRTTGVVRVKTSEKRAT